MLYSLSTTWKRKNYHMKILHFFIGSISSWIDEKATLFSKEKYFLPPQYTSVYDCHDQIVKQCCELLLPCFPDLTSCNFFFFINIKKWLGGIDLHRMRRSFLKLTPIIRVWKIYFLRLRDIEKLFSLLK